MKDAAFLPEIPAQFIAPQVDLRAVPAIHYRT